MKWFWLLVGLLAVLLLSPCPVRGQLQCNAGSASRQKRLVIRNPAVGKLSELDSCLYELAPWSVQVCQVRIDIERLELAEPQLNATTQLLKCVDFLQMQRFQLCGRNNGQHLYVQLQRGQTLKLHFKLPSHSALAAWQLTLTQLECPASMLSMQPATATATALPTMRPMLPFLGNLLPRTIFGSNAGSPGPAVQLLQSLTAPSLADLELLAPMGCDQYWHSATGRISSFNFGSGIYMPNMKYAICVAGGINQQISYSVEHFALSSYNTIMSDPGYDEACHSTVETLGRASDYLLIANSYVANNPTLQPTYYCGLGLAGTQLIAHPPFVIYVSTDAQSSASETGFQLTYKLQQSSASSSSQSEL